jgi:hypothetical protein
MRRLLIVFAVVMVAAIAYRSLGSAETGTGTLTLQQPAPNAGEQVRGFAAETVDGESYHMKEEGVYVLTFWSTLNQGASQARPGFENLANEYAGSSADFVAIYVNSAPQDDAETPYAVVSDHNGKLAARYNVKHVPRLFLVRDGVVELVQNGYYEDNEDVLRTKLSEVLAEEREQQEARERRIEERRNDA